MPTPLAQGHGPIAAAIADYIRDHGAAAPAVTWSVLSGYYASPVDRLVATAEALYAARDVLDEAAWTLAAQLAQVGLDQGFHPGGFGDRAAGIIRSLRRALGELSEIEAPSFEDPAPIDIYIPGEP